MTNEYDDIASMWMAAIGELTAVGQHSDSRVGPMVEVLGWAGTIRDPHRNFLLNSRRAISPSYCSAELLWYLSRKNTVEALLPYAPMRTMLLMELRSAPTGIASHTTSRLGTLRRTTSLTLLSAYLRHILTRVNVF